MLAHHTLLMPALNTIYKNLTQNWQLSLHLGSFILAARLFNTFLVKKKKKLRRGKWQNVFWLKQLQTDWVTQAIGKTWLQRVVMQLSDCVWNLFYKTLKVEPETPSSRFGVGYVRSEVSWRVEVIRLLLCLWATKAAVITIPASCKV